MNTLAFQHLSFPLRVKRHAARRFRPEFEYLESRCLPSANGIDTRTINAESELSVRILPALLEVAESESNDTLAGAQQLLGASGYAVHSAAIASFADVDYYSFFVPSGSTVSINIRAANPDAHQDDQLDPIIGLFDPRGNLIDTDDDGGTGSRWAAGLTFTADRDGFWAIAVSDYNDFDFNGAGGDFDGFGADTGDYLLTISGDAQDLELVEGESFDLSALFTDSEGEGAHVAAIDWGDGSPTEIVAVSEPDDDSPGTITASHVFSTPGNFEVTIGVQDADGNSNHDSILITVINAPLAAFDGETIQAVEGMPLASLENKLGIAVATFSDGGNDEALLYSALIDWGDGATSAGIVTRNDGFYTVFGNHTYADDGLYAISVDIKEPDGDHDQAVNSANVANLPPTVTLVGDIALVEKGSTFVQLGGFADPGSDQWTATVDYGDGPGVQPLALNGNTFSLSHAYADEGTFTVTVTVTDDEGGVGFDSKFVISVLRPDLIKFSIVAVIMPGEVSNVGLGEDLDGDGVVDDPELQVGFTLPADADGPATLFLSSYTQNPIGDNTIVFQVSVGQEDTTAETLAFFDIRVTKGDGATATVVFDYPDDVTEVPVLTIFDSASNTWKVVRGSTVIPNSYVVDADAHTITVIFDETSFPLISALDGTVFTVGVTASTPVTTTVRPPATVAFAGNSSALVNGLARKTTFTSSTQLTLALSASQDSRLGARNGANVSLSADTTRSSDGEEELMTEEDFFFWLLEFGDEATLQEWLKIKKTAAKPMTVKPKPAETKTSEHVKETPKPAEATNPPSVPPQVVPATFKNAEPMPPEESAKKNLIDALFAEVSTPVGNPIADDDLMSMAESVEVEVDSNSALYGWGAAAVVPLVGLSGWLVHKAQERNRRPALVSSAR